VLSTADAASHQLFKTDCIIEQVHFLPTAVPSQIGWKALCRCISDIAAMGGQPTEAVITVAAPQECTWARLRGIYQGLTKAARRYGVAIVGGETSSLPTGAPLLLSVAMLGTVAPRRLLTRSGGRVGDLILVTGALGGSLSGWHLNFTPRLAEAQWLAAHFPPTAMMDLRDGLASDLPRLATASGVGYTLQPETLPLNRGCTPHQALSDGEDYELLFTLAPEKLSPLQAAWKQQFPRLKLTAVGALTNKPISHKLRGWEHFTT
jgi:thiamine-monophosphate kinase